MENTNENDGAKQPSQKKQRLKDSGASVQKSVQCLDPPHRRRFNVPLKIQKTGQ